ncbi:MAG: insulinase family protein [Bacteroidota bacterium]|nr:insulinase family protein [Bacteroidota bacterium]
MTNPFRAPKILPITDLHLPVYETSALSNGIPMYLLKGGSEPVMKIECVFRAGGWYEHKPGVAEFMAGLMSEGTKKLSSVLLAEHIESRGATIQTRGGVDTVRVRLYTLTRYLPELMEIITDVIRIPAFDEGELNVYAANKIERAKIDLKKNEVIAYRQLTESIYGTGHPYGRNIMPEEYLSILTSDLHLHHQHYIRPERAMVYVSGSFGAKEEDIIHHTLGQWQPGHTNGVKEVADTKGTSQKGYLVIDGPQSHQAAIRIGRPLFTQDHSDFPGMYILNTILGGYFGSRLMTEIRENQGMTYGIYSSVDTFAKDGCFYISTETATDNIDKVIDAIREETKKLRTELIPEDELLMARNYLMGNLMTQLDGPFSSLDFIKSMKMENLEDEAFSHLVGAIQGLTSEDLLKLAEQYLDLDQCITIVVK